MKISSKSIDQTVIKVENIGMKFNLSKEKVDNLKEYVIKLLKHDVEIFYQEFWALKNIYFEVQKGDKLGIVGLNGAGKSTLLKLISGVMKPTEGFIETKGRIVPLLELGAGFDQNYTGRENIFLNGALLGYPKSFIENKFDEIVDFSELSDFIDVPLKNYSSGMRMRLGFSIATVTEPEILILDEILSVGDAKFQKKSEERMKSFLNKDVTVLFVSHSIQQVRNLCNKAIWLEKGKLVMLGSVDEVCDAYLDSMNPDKIKQKSDAKIGSNIKHIEDFNRHLLVNALDLHVNKGEILGLLGINDKDKVNSLNPIMEFFRSNNNRILIDDEETKLLNNKHIGICSMELILWNNLTCRENLNLMGNMYKIPKKILKQKVERLLYELYLTYDADTVVSKLSDGVQRRLNLAMALIHEPQILIMDEPFHGLDHQSHVIIWNYIQSLRDMEKIVIINTHNLDEADSISDRIAIIDKGQIIRMDTPLNLKKDIKGGDLVDIKLSNPNKNQVVINSLKDLKDIYWVDEVNGRINLRMKDAIIKLPLLIDKIKESNVHLKNLSVHQNTLGEVFTELTGISLEESK